MSTKKRKVLAVIRIGSQDATRSRINEAAKNVIAVIDRLSEKENQLAFTTKDGDSFGILMKTDVPLRVLREELCGTSKSSAQGSPLLNNDSCLLLEIGEEFDGRGFSRAWTWLQHH